jgi:uncharacterized protein
MMRHINSMKTMLRDMAEQYGLADIYAFGSRAEEALALLRGQAAKTTLSDSDMDIGVLTRPGSRLGARERVTLMMELEDLFAVQRVDLVFLDEADAFLALDIIRGNLLYTESPDRQAHYELFVLRRAGDLLPFKKQRMEMILREGAR